MSSLSGIGNSLYDGAASLGTAEGYMEVIIGGILSIIIIIVGIYLIFINQKDLVDGTGIISNAQCNPNVAKNETMHNCNLTVHYSVNGKSYNNVISLISSTPYTVGENVNITYNSSNPNEVTAHRIRDKTFGYIALVVGIVMALCVFYKYYMTTHSKVYAAAEGATEGIDMMKNIFRAF